MSDLPPDFDDEMLHQIFDSYGVITQCRVLPSLTPGQGTCAALIRFATVEEATWVVENLNGNIPKGLQDPIRVKYAETPESKAAKKGYGKAGGGKSDVRSAPYREYRDVRDAREGRGNSGVAALPYDDRGSRSFGKGESRGGDDRGHRGGDDRHRGRDDRERGSTDDRGYKGRDDRDYRDSHRSSDYKSGDHRGSDYRKSDDRHNGADDRGGRGGDDRGHRSSDDRGHRGGEDRHRERDRERDHGGNWRDDRGGKGDDRGGKGGKSWGKGGSSGTGIRAIHDHLMHQQTLPGSQPGGYINDVNALYIANLPPDTNDLDLYKIFSSFGAVAPKGVRAMINKDDGTCKGIGFVNFLEPASVDTAVETLNGMDLPDGSRLVVKAKAGGKDH